MSPPPPTPTPTPTPQPPAPLLAVPAPASPNPPPPASSSSISPFAVPLTTSSAPTTPQTPHGSFTGRPETPLDFLRNLGAAQSTTGAGEAEEHLDDANEDDDDNDDAADVPPFDSPAAPSVRTIDDLLQTPPTPDPRAHAHSRQSPHRRQRSDFGALHADRHPVDPKIRGIPQGWADDFSVALPQPAPSAHEVALPPPPPPRAGTALPGGAPPALQPAPPIYAAPSRQGSSRILSLRDNTSRIRLASLSAMRTRTGRFTGPTAGTGTGTGSAGERAPATRPAAVPPRSDSLVRTPTHTRRGAYPPTPTPMLMPAAPLAAPHTLDDRSSLTAASQTESIDSASTDFANLFTPSPDSRRGPADTPESSVLHSQSESAHAAPSSAPSRRERVLGLVPAAGTRARQAKVFLPPNIDEVLPFLSGPLAAWDTAEPEPEKREKTRRQSMRIAQREPSAATAAASATEGWRDLPKPRASGAGKRVWVNDRGEHVGGTYKVGWERDVLDLEARLHETMYEVAGERHTLVDYEQSEQPKLVLDIGTGIGAWPISQALVWPDTQFIGIDLVPCQTDLAVLAAAERNARSTTGGTATGPGVWGSVEKRITFKRANFLDRLPFDSGVFDMVHMRFVGLGIPEAKWADVFDEVARVLKPGGKFELVETDYTAPASASPSVRNAFASLLLAELVAPSPLLPVQMVLPALDAFTGVSRPVLAHTYKAAHPHPHPPGALTDARTVWVASALEYKGTGLVTRHADEAVRRAKDEMRSLDRARWAWDQEEDTDAGGAAAPDGAGTNAAAVWGWVMTRK
ncbi:hypothetical protein Q5752_001655 [Cryptotrichosporon argae]